MPDDKSEPVSIGKLQLTTATENSKRASILPTKGSEDMSSLLEKITVLEQTKTRAN